MAAEGAGLVFVCNPNNPTGSVHRASDIESFVRQVKQRSPNTAILIDEAYIEYTYDPQVRTAAALTQELPGVFITRSLSKAHGMAGLRVGYTVGQPETVSRITQAWNLGSMNTLSAAAAIASIEDTAHIQDEIAENARVRDYVMDSFAEMGYEGLAPHSNCVFIDLGRPASAFREACLAQGVGIGRDFPPFEQTHSRISLGTMEEMQRAVSVFREVLSS
jgi:histidinol-phosphate aminotransferase